MTKSLVYKKGDPCLDGYFSIEKQHLIFGARRLGPSGSIIDAMTCSFTPLPFNKLLGSTLLAQLSLTRKTLSPKSSALQEIQTGKYNPITISESGSHIEFFKKYYRFSLWTKDNDDTPYLIGIPPSSRFPIGENSRSINKHISDEELGFEFKIFLADFIY